MTNPSSPRSEWRPGSLNHKESDVRWLEILDEHLADTVDRTLDIPSILASRSSCCTPAAQPVPSDTDDSTDIMVEVPTLPPEAWAAQPLPARKIDPLSVPVFAGAARAEEKPAAALSALPSPVGVDASAGASARASRTDLLTLSPQFLAALRGIAPKKRSSKLPYILVFAVFAVLGILASDASARDFVVEKAQESGLSLPR
jgi:hypothetical protein